MREYINKDWQEILAHNGLLAFEAWWELECNWFEPPNQRRGGWSGVSRYELELPAGGKAAVFLKREENHGIRSALHPLTGIPTFLLEFKRIMTYRSLSIPTLVPVYFAMREEGKDQRAILITEELTGFVSLAAQERQWLNEGLPSRDEKQRIIKAIADLLRSLHSNRIRHGCFYPEHVFIRTTPEGTVETRVIDLENSRRHLLRKHCALRDLYTLGHYVSAEIWQLTDRLRFLKAYLGITHMDDKARKLWNGVVERSQQRHKLNAR